MAARRGPKLVSAHLGYSECTPTRAILASPASDDIFLFMAAWSSEGRRRAGLVAVSPPTPTPTPDSGGGGTTAADEADEAGPAADCSCSDGGGGSGAEARKSLEAEGGGSSRFSPPPPPPPRKAGGCAVPGIDSVDSGFLSWKEGNGRRHMH